MKVYHYTSKGSLQQILSSGKIYPVASLGMSDDSVFGAGWYFTNLPPEETDIELLQSLWLIHEPSDYLKDRITSYLEFEIDEEYLTLSRPHIYKLSEKYITDRILDIKKEYVNKLNVPIIKFLKSGIRK